ncbi:MAG: TMEM175 family protein [Pseudohongiellaceae bacterium]
MDVLSQNYLKSCRRDGGLTLRGENMTRIETFVDAAFAFSFTMLVISIDQIPRSPPELLELSRDIPAFVISAAIIGAIWLAQTTWSRIFGLQDGVTVLLSLSLVVLVLIFVYPIKLMIQASVEYLSGGVWGMNLFNDIGWANNSVASLFVYFSLGLIALSLIVISLYLNALRYRRQLVLSEFEIHFCQHACVSWIVVALVAVVSMLMALSAPEGTVARAGNIYSVLFVAIPVAQRIHLRLRPAPDWV